MPTQEYQLPQLKPPSSYAECQNALRLIDNKVQHALSSPSRTQYKVIIESTNIFLARGSLHEMEVAQAYIGTKATHKRKLIARKSLGKGAHFLLAIHSRKSKISRGRKLRISYGKEKELSHTCRK